MIARRRDRTLITNSVDLPSSFHYWSHRVHAALGFYVLSHFIYRYYIFSLLSSSHHDDMGFALSMDDRYYKTYHSVVLHFVQIFLPHLLLQLSGFAFHLPAKRHPDGNRIWPQYRWEALIFCCRCLSLAFIAYRRKYINVNWSLEHDDNYCTILPASICVSLTMILADLNSNWYKAHDKLNYSPTIRGLSAPKWLQYLMSGAQFHATVHCLLTSNRLSVQIAALTVVQLSAFGMTLRRKGYITQQLGVALYALVLILGMIVILDDLRRRSIINLAFCFGNTAAVLRMYMNMNKYYLWIGVAVLLTMLVSEGMLHDDAVPFSVALNIVSWILLLWTCYCT